MAYLSEPLGTTFVVTDVNDDVIAARDVIVNFPVVNDDMNAGAVDRTSCVYVRRVQFAAHHLRRVRPRRRIVPGVVVAFRSDQLPDCFPASICERRLCHGERNFRDVSVAVERQNGCCRRRKRQG